MSKHLTNHALISVTEKIKYLLDNGNYAAGVFVDLEKAFNTVNHKNLGDKLESYGLRGNINKFKKSYLKDQKQFVSINGFDSNEDNKLWCSPMILTRSFIVSYLY